MEKTIDQLMNRLSPGELINQAFDRFRSGGDSPFTQNLVSQVQNNPVPAVLTACGLTWLMASSKQPPASAGHSGAGLGDRKSTRLNSSHVAISYAVFCLKKKKSTTPT